MQTPVLLGQAACNVTLPALNLHTFNDKSKAQSIAPLRRTRDVYLHIMLSLPFYIGCSYDLKNIFNIKSNQNRFLVSQTKYKYYQKCSSAAPKSAEAEAPALKRGVLRLLFAPLKSGINSFFEWRLPRKDIVKKMHASSHCCVLGKDV